MGWRLRSAAAGGAKRSSHGIPGRKASHHRCCRPSETSPQCPPRPPTGWTTVWANRNIIKPTFSGKLVIIWWKCSQVRKWSCNLYFLALYLVGKGSVPQRALNRFWLCWILNQCQVYIFKFLSNAKGSPWKLRSCKPLEAHKIYCYCYPFAKSLQQNTTLYVT